LILRADVDWLSEMTGRKRLVQLRKLLLLADGSRVPVEPERIDN
jgi:hypothetical protein